MHIFVGVPTIGLHINTRLASWLLRLPRSGERKFSVVIANDIGNVPAARNFLCSLFLESDADRLMFIDYDCCPSPNALHLLSYDEDIVGGTYPTYNGKLSHPGRDGEFVMMGATLIKRSVLEDRRMCMDSFEDLEKERIPALFRQVLQSNGNIIESEDSDFCGRAKATGYSIKFVPTVVFDHIKRIPIGQISNGG